MTTTTAAETEIKANTTEKALARFQQIRDIAAAFPSDRFHLLLPTTYMEVSPLFIPSPVPVTVNPDDEREVYIKPGAKKDDPDPELCFHGQKLQEIANAGGLDFDPSLTRHHHDRKNEPLVCEQITAGWYIDSLGQRRLISSDWVTHDLRDGSPRAQIAASPRQLQVARQFICEQCATRARSRAIRKALKLNTSYRRSELVYLEQVDGKSVRRPKPFVAIRFRLNEEDEDVKRALIARGVGAATEVFGSVAAGQVLDERGSRGRDELEDVIDGEVIDARGGSSGRADSSAPAERGGSTAEAGGSTPPPRSAEVDPDPVDEEPAVDENRAALIRAHVEQLRVGLKWSKDAREKRPTAQQAGASVSAIAAAIADPKQLHVEHKKAVWRAVMEFLWGSFGSWEELSNDQASVSIDWAKNNADEVRELVTFLAGSNERIAEIAAALSGQQQLGVAS